MSNKKEEEKEKIDSKTKEKEVARKSAPPTKLAKIAKSIANGIGPRSIHPPQPILNSSSTTKVAPKELSDHKIPSKQSTSKKISNQTTESGSESEESGSSSDEGFSPSKHSKTLPDEQEGDEDYYEQNYSSIIANLFGSRRKRRPFDYDSGDDIKEARYSDIEEEEIVRYSFFLLVIINSFVVKK